MGSQAGAPGAAAAATKPDERPRCRFCGLPLSSASSHKELCANLQMNGLLRTEDAAAAFERVDRCDFVPPGMAEAAYLDGALVLGAGSQISAPHVHASALDLLVEHLEQRFKEELTEPLRVLDVGAGSGYMCTLLAHVLRRRGQGTVLGIEHIEELAAAANESARLHHSELLAPGCKPAVLEIRSGDARQLAKRRELAEYFHVVHCGAALEEPAEWLLQLLKPGGRIVLPLGPTDAPQWLCTVDKSTENTVEVKKHIRVLYVPVTSAATQRDRGEHWNDVVERCVRNSAAALSPTPATVTDEELEPQLETGHP